MAQGYGGPPQAQGYGDPSQQPGGGGPLGQPPGGGGPLGEIRSPMTSLLVVLLTCGCGYYYGQWQVMKADEEISRYLGQGEGGGFAWLSFPIFPTLKMAKKIGEARAKAGTPTQGDGSTFMYLFFGFYFILKDINEIWEHLGVQPKLGIQNQVSKLRLTRERPRPLQQCSALEALSALCGPSDGGGICYG